MGVRGEPGCEGAGREGGGEGESSKVEDTMGD